MGKSKSKLILVGKDLSRIAIGDLFMAFAYAKWMVPNQVINGGTTSLSMVIEKITGIPLLFVTNILNIVLLILCYLFLGKSSFMKSFFSSMLYVLFFSFWYETSFNLTVHPVFDLGVASLFIAFGYYCCIISGASTVGLDVIALIIHKYKRRWSLAKLIRWLNYAVLIMGFLVYGWQAIGIGLIFSFVYSFLLQKMLGKEKK